MASNESWTLDDALYKKYSCVTQEDETILLQIYHLHIFLWWEDPIPEKDKTSYMDMWQKKKTNAKKTTKNTTQK